MVALKKLAKYHEAYLRLLRIYNRRNRESLPKLLGALSIMLLM